VCPKHRNIRRENLRVRCQQGAVSFPMAWQWKMFFICVGDGAAKPPGKFNRSMLVPEATPLIA